MPEMAAASSQPMPLLSLSLIAPPKVGTSCIGLSHVRSRDQSVRRHVSAAKRWSAALGGRSRICEEPVFGLRSESGSARRIGQTEPRASLEKEKPHRPSLEEICRCLHKCFFEICVQNLGRPAGKALHEFVRAAVSAFIAGYTRDKLALQLGYGDAGVDEFKHGYRLTASEEQYRIQWLDTIYVTMRLLKVVDNEASRAPAVDNHQLISISCATTDGTLCIDDVDGRQRVVEGQRTGEEQSFVKFDRGLATKGASGGAIAEKQVIAPQWIPVTQLVLLTLKVVNEAT